MAACNQCAQDNGTDLYSGYASYARENAEYFYYCSLWWWELFMKNRGASVASCECFDLPSVVGEVDSPCECSFRDFRKKYAAPGVCCGDSSCCGDLVGYWTNGVQNNGQHFHTNNNWNQVGTDRRGCLDNSTEYITKSGDHEYQEWAETPGQCDDPTESAKDHKKGLHDQDSSDYETIEMEVNEDFKKFLEQSKRYREDRDKEKQESKESEGDDDYIEVGSEPLHATSNPPSEQQGLERKKAMEDLYGEQLEHIMSLETSLQLNYDRSCDVRQPIFWPSIPLKF